MIKAIKDIGSAATLFQVDLSKDINHGDFTPINKCLDNMKEPVFSIAGDDCTIANCTIVNHKVTGHEDDLELAKRNLFLQCLTSNARLLDFLHKYSEQYGCWINKVTKEPSQEQDKVNQWFNFIDETGHILLKITDQSEYYIRNEKTIKHTDFDWESQNLEYDRNKPISLVICRGYDIISQQSYWCLNQLVVSTL